MTSNLIVNPLATIDTDDDGSFVSGGPVPGRGMKYLEISEPELPTLYSLFSELSRIGLSNLNIESDLNDAEFELLRDHGILIEADNVPERPLFACMLSDVEGGRGASSSLIVNPTLEFQPFDLTNFRSWIRDRHLSPHFATAWVTDPKTEMRWGYWLDQDQADLIGRLKPGESPLNEIDAAVTARLFSAAILIDKDAGPEAIGAKASDFAERRYTVLEDVIPPAQLRALQSYYRRYVDQGFMRFGDEFVSRRFFEHGEHIGFMVLNNLLPLMRRLAGVNLTPTYSYSAVYDEGAELLPHIDRDLCEFSFSFQLDYVPEPEDGISPWPLYLSINQSDDFNVDPKKDRGICLSNGSCLAYRGRELVHYRTPLPEGHRSTSLFFHYVPA